MLRFTTSHPILFDVRRDAQYSSIYSTNIDDHIWIVLNYYIQKLQAFDNQIAVFDTKTHEATVLDCDIPNIPRYNVTRLESYGDKLYIFMKNHRDRQDHYKILTLDPKTMIFTEVFEMIADEILHLRIIGDYMFVLKRDYRLRQDSVMRINLTKNVIENQSVLVAKSDNPLLFTTEKQFIENYEKQKKLEAKIKRDGKQKAASFIFKISKLADDWFMQSSTQLFKTDMFTFDFIKHEDSIAHIEHVSENQPYHLEFATKIENTVFLMLRKFKNNTKESPKSVIRILELNPKLSDICLLQLVDELMPNKKKIGDILPPLPIPMREKFLNMMEWRKPNKDG